MSGSRASNSTRASPPYEAKDTVVICAECCEDGVKLASEWLGALVSVSAVGDCCSTAESATTSCCSSSEVEIGEAVCRRGCEARRGRCLDSGTNSLGLLAQCGIAAFLSRAIFDSSWRVSSSTSTLPSSQVKSSQVKSSYLLSDLLYPR